MNPEETPTGTIKKTTNIGDRLIINYYTIKDGIIPQMQGILGGLMTGSHAPEFCSNEERKMWKGAKIVLLMNEHVDLISLYHEINVMWFSLCNLVLSCCFIIIDHISYSGATIKNLLVYEVCWWCSCVFRVSKLTLPSMLRLLLLYPSSLSQLLQIT